MSNKKNSKKTVATSSLSELEKYCLSQYNSEIAEEIARVKAAELEEEKIEQENAKRLTFFEAIAEAIEAYINEAAHHFVKKKSKYVDEESRYFYTKTELDKFLQKFAKYGGNRDDLHIGIVYRRSRFLCYEVARRKYYDDPKYFDFFYSEEKEAI